MTKIDSPTDIRDSTVSEMLEAIGSAEPTSGAGIAAALSLALSASCAIKAVEITRKHSADATLENRGAKLRELRERALESARIDEDLFGKFLKDHQPRDAAMLIIAAKEFQVLAQELGKELADLSTMVYATVVADVAAARALHDAALQVGGLIVHDNRSALAKMVR